MSLKIAFIGLGSIAKRHISNVVDVLAKSDIDFQIDIVRSSKREIPAEILIYISDVYYSFESTPDNYDIVFVTNPTQLHEETVKYFSKKTKHMFIEKPIFSSTDIDFDTIQIDYDSVYYVACPLRYKKVIQSVKNSLDFSQVIGVRAISSSYLPDWRPNQDYRETYSAHKHLGGGVEIDLIHEWDYLTYLFGFPSEVQSIIRKKSNLEIDSSDIALYIGENEQMTFELHLDYYGRETIRKFEIFTTYSTIVVDLIQNTITDGENISKFEEDRDDFQKAEIETFLEMIIKGTQNTNDMQNALNVLKITIGE